MASDNIKAMMQAIARGKEAERNLEQVRLHCAHDWSEPKRDDIVRSAYTVPADPPGTMGVDRRISSFHVPESRTERWSRTCSICDRVEYTTQTTKRTIETPKFGG